MASVVGRRSLTRRWLEIAFAAMRLQCGDAQCGVGFYRSASIVTLCEGSSGLSASVALKSGLSKVLVLPTGVSGAYVKLSSSTNDVDAQLFDSSSPTCVVGHLCSVGGSGGTWQYFGMDVYYSGGDSSLPVSETISITGTTTRNLTVYAKAYGPGSATAEYSHGTVSPCPSPTPGCSPCSAFTACALSETASCDGSATVVCIKTTTTSTTRTATLSSTTTTTSSRTATTTTTTADRVDVLVTGTVVVALPSGGDLCADPASTALKSAFESGFSSAAGVVIAAKEFVISVAGCAGGGRRLGTASTTVSYMLKVEGVHNTLAAQAIVSAIAASFQTFTSAFVDSLQSAGIASSVISASLPAAAQPAPTLSLALWDNDTSTNDCRGVASTTWRVVGRDAPLEWQVHSLGFYQDAACTDKISTIPRRSARGPVNGRAFSGPMRRGAASVADLLDGGGPWRSRSACGAFSDACHLGFEWVSGSASATPQRYSRTPFPRREAVAPQCVLLEQSSVTGRFATVALVQYRAAGEAQWRTLAGRAGLTGGIAHLRVPVAR